jgi:hypothetical protein
VTAAPEHCDRCGAALAPDVPWYAPSVRRWCMPKTSKSCRPVPAHMNRRGSSSAAQGDWAAMLQLLPADSSQAQWVRERLVGVTRGIAAAGAKKANPAWTRKLGPFAPVVLFLLKGKFFFSLLKLKFLLSFVGFAGIYWALYGAKFGIGLAVLILLHECGHFIAVKRRGLPADLPVFIPGLRRVCALGCGGRDSRGPRRGESRGTLGGDHRRSGVRPALGADSAGPVDGPRELFGADQSPEPHPPRVLGWGSGHGGGQSCGPYRHCHRGGDVRRILSHSRCCCWWPAAPCFVHSTRRCCPTRLPTTG